MAGFLAIIQDAYLAYFHTINAHCDNCVKRNAIVPTAKFRFVRKEKHFLLFRNASDWLAGGRP